MMNKSVSYSLLVLLLFAAWLDMAKAADNLINEARFKRAAKLTHFNFEPGGDELESEDFDGNGWPDYWLKIVDDVNKPYLANEIRIVQDKTRPGRLPGEVGNVLRMPFDGTGIALRTRVPIEINPDMAYEISMWGRSLRLEHSIAALTLRWINFDDDGAENILQESSLQIPPGQLDWTEAPLSIRVNSVPARATYLVLLLSVYNNPIYTVTDRDGMVWIDDINISSRPKIFMAPTFRNYVPGGPDEPPPPPIDFDINYKGLVDNVPEIERERSQGQSRSYYRTVEIQDIFGNPPKGRDGRPLELTLEGRKGIFPGTLTSFPERIKINLEQLGVYYLTVVLYGYNGARLAERTQVLGLWLPPMRRKLGIDEAASSGGFGVVIEDIPDALLRNEGTLANIVERTGAQYVKSILWPNNTDENAGDSERFMSELNRELTLIRRSGVRITALLAPPQTIIGDQDLYALMRNRPDTIAPYTDQVTTEFDTQIENWQWGGERERSFSYGIDPESVREALRLLSGKTSSPAQSFTVSLDASNLKLPPADLAYAGTLFVPAAMSPSRMLERYIQLLPHYFSIFRQPEQRLYPPMWLYDLSPKPEVSDETQEPRRRLEEWATIALRSGLPEAHNPRLEREMLDDMARKLVLTRVAGLPRAYVAPLIGATAGLARLDVDGNPVPMPALLGLRVLSEYMNGSSYLGSFLLRNQHGDFPNYVFARAGGTEAFCVVWLENSQIEEAPLDFGGGYRLSIVDMQGNTRPLDADTAFIATRTPQIITGMSVPFARTRMSIRILPSPKLKMLSVPQRQYLAMTNFYPQSISGEIMINYAARDDFEYEPNWDVQPQKLRFDIARPRKEEPRDYIVGFQVRPPDNSPVDAGKEFGEKLLNLRVSMMTDRPQNLRLLRKTDLTGDIRMTIRRLTSPDDQGVDVIQMKLRWIPEIDTPHKAEILLRPFFRKGGEMQTMLPSVVVPATREGDEDTPPVPVEYRIPREPRAKRTMIGYVQEDGARFFNYNASQMVGSLVE